MEAGRRLNAMQDAVRWTVLHFYNPAIHDLPSDRYELDRSLNYYLCSFIYRFIDTFDEPPTRREVILFCEHWMLLDKGKPVVEKMFPI